MLNRNVFGDYSIELEGEEYDIAIRQAGDFMLYFNINETGEIKKLIKARDIWDQFIEGNYKGLLRKLSVTVQLSNPEDYEGGGFEQMYLKKEIDGTLDKHISTLEEVASRGSILVFPGYIYHRVLPVSKGVRKSLVGWATGKPYV